MHRAAIHHEIVRPTARTTVLLGAATLLLWHGVLATLPHDHADSTVPREVVSCSASQETLPTDHLHSSDRVLMARACLACLAGSTVTCAPEVENLAVAAISGSSMRVASLRPQPLLHTSLPLLRGPPVTT